MSPHSSTLGCKIPWTEEPGRLQSMGSRKVEFTFTFHFHALEKEKLTSFHQRRKWQPTPVFLPGESQGWGSLVGCSLCGLTESDTTEATQQLQQLTEIYYRILKSGKKKKNLFLSVKVLLLPQVTSHIVQNLFPLLTFKGESYDIILLLFAD